MFDAAARVTSKGGEISENYFFGVDFHKVFSSGNRDIATLTFQPMFMQMRDISRNDIQWRAINLNYTGLSSGQFNIRVGHIELPFGAEFTLNDNGGNLRQLTTNLGMKMDWGASANGIIDKYSYEFAVTRGGGRNGQDWDRPDGSSVVSGRIGLQGSKDREWGFSFFDGTVLSNPKAMTGELTDKKRLAIDYQQEFSSHMLRIELSSGRDGEDDREYSLVEVSSYPQEDDVFFYGQHRYRYDSDKGKSEYFISGLEWRPLLNTYLSLQYTIDLSGRLQQDNQLKAQARYRFR